MLAGRAEEPPVCAQLPELLWLVGLLGSPTAQQAGAAAIQAVDLCPGPARHNMRGTLQGADSPCPQALPPAPAGFRAETGPVLQMSSPICTA